MDKFSLSQVTRIFRVEKKRVPKPVATRRKWAKFGDAAKDVKGPDPATTNIADEVFLTLITNVTVCTSSTSLYLSLSLSPTILTHTHNCDLPGHGTTRR